MRLMDNFPSCRGHIVAEVDVERMRREARALATHAGFDRHGAEAILLAVSELATNLVRYAPGGELVVSIVSEANGVGILIQSSDPGPGIVDVELALRDGYSTTSRSSRARQEPPSRRANGFLPSRRRHSCSPVSG